jgi:hypothetical protein
VILNVKESEKCHASKVNEKKKTMKVIFLDQFHRLKSFNQKSEKRLLRLKIIHKREFVMLTAMDEINVNIVLSFLAFCRWLWGGGSKGGGVHGLDITHWIIP